MNCLLLDNDVNIYSGQKRRKLVFEIFSGTLNTKIYKYVTSITKSRFIDKLNERFNENSNPYNRKIEIKSIDIKTMRIGKNI